MLLLQYLHCMVVASPLVIVCFTIFLKLHWWVLPALRCITTTYYDLKQTEIIFWNAGLFSQYDHILSVADLLKNCPQAKVQNIIISYDSLPYKLFLISCPLSLDLSRYVCS